MLDQVARLLPGDLAAPVRHLLPFAVKDALEQLCVAVTGLPLGIGKVGYLGLAPTHAAAGAVLSVAFRAVSAVKLALGHLVR
jgi:hypothetical protein